MSRILTNDQNEKHKGIDMFMQTTTYNYCKYKRKKYDCSCAPLLVEHVFELFFWTEQEKGASEGEEDWESVNDAEHCYFTL